MELRQVVYTSIATTKMSSREILDLLHDARGFNAVDGITGLLIHSDGHFMQVIEGSDENVEDLLQRLKRDTRHKDIHIVTDRKITERMFPNWSMGCADFDDPILATLPGVETDLTDPSQVEELVQRIFHNPEEWWDIIDKRDLLSHDEKPKFY